MARGATSWSLLKVMSTRLILDSAPSLRNVCLQISSVQQSCMDRQWTNKHVKLELSNLIYYPCVIIGVLSRGYAYGTTMYHTSMKTIIIQLSI